MEWTSFLPHVLPWVNGCPDPLVVDHVRKAAREFAARTLVWNYTAVPIDSIAGHADYTLQIREDEEAVRILRCEVDGTKYPVPNGVVGRQAARRGSGPMYTMLNPFDFRLSPPPALSGLDIVVDVAVKPSLTSERWPDDFAEHTEAIATGAIASLASLPRKEWTDPLVAATKRAAFDERMGKVAFKTERGMGTDRQAARLRFF